MAKKSLLFLGMVLLSFMICGSLTSCFSSGTARETLPQTAVTIQRVRATDTFLGELLGATIDSLDTPMQIFIDNNNEPVVLANGASTTIVVNNGEHIVYAVLGNMESRSVRFTAKSQTISINVSIRKPLIGRETLEIEVK